MDLRQALLATVGIPVGDDNILIKALIDVGLGDDIIEEYEPSMERAINVAAMYALLAIKSVKTEHEGTHIVSLSLEGINERLLMLARKTGRFDLVEDITARQPRIYDGSHHW